jgi:signal transduction histidine kinase
MQIGDMLDRKGHQVYAVRPESTVREATAQIAKHNIGSTVVTDAAGKLVGILSERDLVRLLAEHGNALLEQCVSRVMTAAVVTCEPETTIGEALSLMAAHRIRHLPVVRGDAVQGLISIRDVLEFRLESLEENFAALLRGKREAAQASRAVGRAERGKAEFVAGLAGKMIPALHNILDLTADLASAIAERPVAADQLRDLQDIDASGRNALETLDRAVALTQLHSGERVPALVRVELSELIAGAADAARERATTKGVRIVVSEACAAVRPIVADRRMVREMLHQLFGNAVEFTPSGGAVKVDCAMDGEGGVWLSIADAGIGMTPEQIANATRPFYRADELTTHRDAGIGVALVDAMIRAHDGTLLLESRLGIGTTATLRFPPQPAAAPDAEAAD